MPNIKRLLSWVWPFNDFQIWWQNCKSYISELIRWYSVETCGGCCSGRTRIVSYPWTVGISQLEEKLKSSLKALLNHEGQTRQGESKRDKFSRILRTTILPWFAPTKMSVCMRICLKREDTLQIMDKVYKILLNHLKEISGMTYFTVYSTSWNAPGKIHSSQLLHWQFRNFSSLGFDFTSVA